MNKNTQRTIENKFPIFWKYSMGLFELRAITVQNENGSQRTALLYSTPYYSKCLEFSNTLPEQLRKESLDDLDSLCSLYGSWDARDQKVAYEQGRKN